MIERDWVRPPAPLPQPERNACLSSVMANVVYMAGLTESPDIAAMDVEFGRQPGEAVHDNAAYLNMLGKGFELEFFSPFDDGAFIDRGLDYLHEYYADTWADASFNEYWTPEKLAERQAARVADRQEFAAYQELFTETSKTPDLNDIDSLLDDKQAVYVCMNGSSGLIKHAALVYAREPGDSYMAYVPEKDPAIPTICAWSRDLLEEDIAFEAGIVGIKPPQKALY